MPLAPGVDAQHEMTAFRPEECVVFTSHTFVAWEFVTYFNVPAYGEWLAARKAYANVFRWHRQMLRHLGSAAPNATAGTPWVLKTPFHAAMLDDIVAEYPHWMHACMHARTHARTRARAHQADTLMRGW